MKKILIGILGIFFIAGCTKKFDTGIIGTVEYGEGDCMPMIDYSERESEFEKYSGTLYFIEKRKLENLGPDDFEQLKKSSRSSKVRKGKLNMELPPDTFVVMPEQLFCNTPENTIIIFTDEITRKDFKFWRCTTH